MTAPRSGIPVLSRYPPLPYRIRWLIIEAVMARATKLYIVVSVARMRFRVLQERPLSRAFTRAAMLTDADLREPLAKPDMDSTRRYIITGPGRVSLATFLGEMLG